MTRTCAFALLTVLATASAIDAAPASAIVLDSSGYSKTAVSYSDLDLSRPADAQVMLSRLHSAARKVCSRTFSEGEIGTHALYRACEKRALDRAVSAVKSPVLAQLYDAPRSGDAPSRFATK